MTNEELIAAARFYYINNIVIPDNHDLVYKIFFKSKEYTMFRVYKDTECVCECSVYTSHLKDIHNVISKKQ